MTFEYKKRPLRRTNFIMSRLVSQALETISTSWNDRLQPSFSRQRTSLDNREYSDEEADLYGDEMAMLETTERILRNLYAAAIYHILEQHLTTFFYRQAGLALGKTLAAMESKKPFLDNVLDEIKSAWNVDLKRTPSWNDIRQNQHVANCVKHGEGPSYEALKRSHPDWFDGYFVTPLGGVGLKLPDDYLEKAVLSAKKFLEEFADELKKLEP